MINGKIDSNRGKLNCKTKQNIDVWLKMFKWKIQGN